MSPVRQSNSTDCPPTPSTNQPIQIVCPKDPCQSTLKVLDIILLENVNLVYSQGGLVLSTIKQFTRMSVCPNTNQFGKIPTRKIQGTFLISEKDINDFDKLIKSCKFAGCKAPQPARTQGIMGTWWRTLNIWWEGRLEGWMDWWKDWWMDGLILKSTITCVRGSRVRKGTTAASEDFMLMNFEGRNCWVKSHMVAARGDENRCRSDNVERYNFWWKLF